MIEAHLVTIAKIMNSQGNRGEVSAEILTDFPERFGALTELCLQGAQQPPVYRALEAFWFHKGRVILKLEGVETISDAELLKGYEVKIPQSAIHPLKEGSYYQHDLIDCVAKDAEGVMYGKVTEVLSTAGNYLLRISDEEGDFLVPFAESMLVRVDIQNKELILSLPEGLEDL